jgi:outer membrane protein OmpA-like peptidoglycan-associated protein
MDEFSELRGLLLKTEWGRLEKLEDRLNDPRWQAEEVAEILPDAIRVGGRHNARLADSLQQPVETCLNISIRRDIQGFADALFPVMGPAIRKSITETLKGLVQSINQTMDHSFSLRGVKWRLEAWRTGRSFGEVVLSHTLLFQVEEVFLIHSETGLLLQHLSREGVAIRDSDAVSAMLTAIQDFTRDSFSTERNEALDTIEMGEHVVWIERGPLAALAVVVRGIPPLELRTVLQDALETVHRSFRPELEAFAGDSSVFVPSRMLLEVCFQSEMRESARRESGLSPAFKILIVFLILALIGGVVWWVGRYREKLQFQDYLAELQITPGIVVIDHGRAQGYWRVQGLRDPLAEDPMAIAGRTAVAAEKVQGRWTPYQDLSSVFVEKRAQRLLEPPMTVGLTIRDEVLHLTGYADLDWVARARQQAPILAGITDIDVSQLKDIELLLLEQLLALLNPPPNVTVTLKKGILTLSGEAPLAWIAGVEPKLEGVPGWSEIRQEQLVPAERKRFLALKRHIEQVNVFFAQNTDFESGQTAMLDALVDDMKHLLTLAKELNLDVSILVTGYTDSTGGKAMNRGLRLGRAQAMKRRLEEAGITSAYLEAVGFAGPIKLSTEPGWWERRVTFSVRIKNEPNWTNGGT